MLIMQSDVFFDLHKQLTTNPNFMAASSKLMQQIAVATAAGDQEKAAALTVKLLQLCEYNPSLLVPYYFPNFSDNTPMTLWSRPHAFSMMGFTFNGSLTVQASRQVGKCVAGDTTIKTATGSMTMSTLFQSAKTVHDKMQQPEDLP